MDARAASTAMAMNRLGFFGVRVVWFGCLVAERIFEADAASLGTRLWIRC